VDGVAGITLVSAEHGMLGCELNGLEETNFMSVPITPNTLAVAPSTDPLSTRALVDTVRKALSPPRQPSMATATHFGRSKPSNATASRPVSRLTSTEATEVFRRCLDAFVTAASSGRNGLAAASQDTDFDDVMRLRQQDLDAVVVDVATQMVNQRPAQRWAELRAGEFMEVVGMYIRICIHNIHIHTCTLAYIEHANIGTCVVAHYFVKYIFINEYKQSCENNR
jgi:hypothetical protein